MRPPGRLHRGCRPDSFSELATNFAGRARVWRPSSFLGRRVIFVNIVGSELYLFQGSTRPTLYDPSFVKTFRTRRGDVDVVRVYREDSSRSDVLAVDWTEDIKVTSAICARRITVS